MRSILAIALVVSACSSTPSATRTPPLSSVTTPVTIPASITTTTSGIAPVAVIRTIDGMLDTPSSDEANPLAYGSVIPAAQLLTPVMIGGGVGYSMTNTNGTIRTSTRPGPLTGARPGRSMVPGSATPPLILRTS